jgi:hypothetical protein
MSRCHGYERLGGVRNAVIGQLDFLAEPVLSPVLDAVLRTAARPPGCRVVVVLDQLEGMTASQTPEAEIGAFVRILRAVVDRSVPLFAGQCLRVALLLRRRPSRWLPLLDDALVLSCLIRS